MLRYALLLGGVLAAFLAGCSDGGDDEEPAARTPADFSGRWSFQVQATSTTCAGAAVPPSVESGYLQIAQAGTALAVEHLDDCGRFVFAAPGSADGHVASMATDAALCSEPPCCYGVEVEETLALLGSALGGEVRITLTSTGCGDIGTPCDLVGTLAASRCPPGDCQSFPPDCP